MEKTLDLKNISPLPQSVIDFLLSLASISKIKRLIIFGSRACGDYEKYSDLDLAIDGDDLAREQWIKIRLDAYYEVKTVFRISVVNFRVNPVRIQDHILNNGEVIYERK